MKELKIGSKWGNFGLVFVIKSVSNSIAVYEGFNSKTMYSNSVDYVLSTMVYLGELK